MASDQERHAELALDADQRAELDRRWARHLAEPGSAAPWDEVKRKICDGAQNPSPGASRRPLPQEER